MIGQTISHYRIVEKLGGGGMGVVYRAQDTRLERPVALKFLPESHFGNPLALERFKREARAASALNHAHICTIHDIGEHESQPFIVMELLEGQTLRRRIEDRALGVEEVLRFGAELADALEAAHSRGVVHRDVKPDNIMVKPDGHVKLLDFGLARRAPTADEGAATEEDTLEATTPGTLLGTVRYMSPEQARAERVHTESDVFSLGLVLYEMATGQHPFASDSKVGTLHAILSGPPVAPSRRNPDVPLPLDGVILQMLEKDRRLRPPAGEVRAVLQGLAAGAPAVARTPVRRERHTVGREPERAELRSAFEATATGRSALRLLCLSGEPGIGKTALAEDFLAELELGTSGARVGRGRCSERLAGTEAYLPIIEALESLIGADTTGSLAGTMRTLAPTWLAQFTPLAGDDSSDARLMKEIQAASPERMKRELAAFVQEASRSRPLVLFLDDLHWADVSTTDLLAYLGGRLASTHALLVVTYRGEEMASSGHPFVDVRLDLQGRGVCRELQLSFLDEEAVASYLALEFPEHRLPVDFQRIVHSTSEGSPLFMVDLVESLRRRDVITKRDGAWELTRGVDEIVGELPESIRSMIERKIGQLADGDRRLLVAASVQGDEFDAAVVARALDADPADVEERLQVLENDFAFVRSLGERELPDGTLTLRHRFVHVLYQNALFASLTPARRASLSRAVAEALLAHHGDEAAPVASELAYLFEQARDFERASEFFHLATKHAGGVFAYPEQEALARRGLGAIRKLERTDAHARTELALLVELGFALCGTRGYGHEEPRQVFDEALELGQRLGEKRQLLDVMPGVWVTAENAGDLQAAQRWGDRYLELAAGDEEHEQYAHVLLGINYFWRGLLDESRAAYMTALRLHRPGRKVFGVDPRLFCLTNLALGRWVAGYPDQARKHLDELEALAREFAHPLYLGCASLWVAWTLQMSREYARASAEAQECLALSEEHDLVTWAAAGRPVLGAAIGAEAVRSGNAARAAEGIAILEEGLQALSSSGAELWRPYFLPELAELLARTGDFARAHEGLGLAFEEGPPNGEGFYRPEMHRVEGQVLMLEAEAMDRSSAPRAEKIARAEACFREALEVARRQGARSWELRAALSLHRLLESQRRGDEGHRILAEIHGWFTEGLDTPDLVEAGRILEGTSGGSN